MTYVNFGSVTAIGILFPVLIIIALAFRVHLRFRHNKKTGVEDVFLVIAAIIDIALGIAVTIGAQEKYLGGHSPVLAYEQFDQSTEQTQVRLLKLEYAVYTTHYFAIGATKLSILFFLRRIFKGIDSRTPFDYCNWTLITLVCLWTIGMTFAQVFECGTQFDGNWSSLSSLSGQCVHTFDMNAASSSINFAMDVFILAEPLIMVSRLHMSRESKIQVCLGFLLATFTVGVALIRMVLWIILSKVNLANPPKTILGLRGEDTLGVLSLFIFWSYVEMGVGCLVASLLPCRKYISALNPSLVYSKIRSYITGSSMSSRNWSLSKDQSPAGAAKGPTYRYRDPLAVSDFELESAQTSKGTL